jgi:hypothetical protein
MVLGRLHQSPNGIVLKRLYYNIAGAAYRPAIAALTSLGFGSDNPFVSFAETAKRHRATWLLRGRSSADWAR